MMNKISVIIPVYNGEKYLKRSIESVLTQTLEDVELVLVDDGSTDSTAEICDTFAEADARVKVVHKENGGLSTARNTGIRVATGTHISFLDADDYMDSNTYETVLHVIEKENPDLIDFGWKYINDYGEITENLHKMPKNCILEKDVLEKQILPPLLNLVQDPDSFIYDFSTNKIYRADILKKYQILFDEQRRTWEDRIFVVEYLKYCKTYYSIDQCFYNYVSVANSLSRRYDFMFFDIIIRNYKLYRELFEDKYDFETAYVWKYWCHSIENMIYRSLKETSHVEKIEHNILNILENELVKKWYRLREPENDLEAQTSALVEAGNGKAALELYRKKLQKDEKAQKRSSLKGRVRGLLKRKK